MKERSHEGSSSLASCTIGTATRTPAVPTVMSRSAAATRAAALGAPVDDALFFAGEATSLDGQGGTVNGALETGERAAREALAASDAGSAVIDNVPALLGPWVNFYVMIGLGRSRTDRLDVRRDHARQPRAGRAESNRDLNVQHPDGVALRCGAVRGGALLRTLAQRSSRSVRADRRRACRRDRPSSCRASCVNGVER